MLSSNICAGLAFTAGMPAFYLGMPAFTASVQALGMPASPSEWLTEVSTSMMSATTTASQPDKSTKSD